MPDHHDRGGAREQPHAFPILVTTIATPSELNRTASDLLGFYDAVPFAPIRADHHAHRPAALVGSGCAGGTRPGAPGERCGRLVRRVGPRLRFHLGRSADGRPLSRPAVSRIAGGLPPPMATDPGTH